MKGLSQRREESIERNIYLGVATYSMLLRQKLKAVVRAAVMVRCVGSQR